MALVHTATRGAADWRSRLGDPNKHWKRAASALETAVSWEIAAKDNTVPLEVATAFLASELGEPELLLAVAEHQVPLAGTGGQSQCDVWALLKTPAGIVSLAVEAKANESFGSRNETLAEWLTSGTSLDSAANRRKRSEFILSHLPARPDSVYHDVPYQIVQRAAAAIIEAKRFSLRHAVFLVQSFQSPEESFEKYVRFTSALRVPTERGRLHFTDAGPVRFGVGWINCRFSTDRKIASVL